jgi:hypothetical protein
MASMAMSKGTGWVLFSLFTIGFCFSLLPLAFGVAVMTYAKALPHGWPMQFYVRLSITTAFGFSWLATAIWLYRHRQRTT